MPNHVECCTYPVLEWIAEHVPQTPVNVMAQFHPDNFCDPGSVRNILSRSDVGNDPVFGNDRVVLKDLLFGPLKELAAPHLDLLGHRTPLSVSSTT